MIMPPCSEKTQFDYITETSAVVRNGRFLMIVSLRYEKEPEHMPGSCIGTSMQLDLFVYAVSLFSFASWILKATNLRIAAIATEMQATIQKPE